jgi:hypothetical protein
MAEITRQFDAVNLRRSAKYLKNGLTVTSDNTSIHPRDAAGNIILQENSDSNPLLIIEPTATKISNNSMLKILNTRFEYFKFPVTTTPTATINPSIEIDSIENIIPDLIYSRFKPSNNQALPTTDFPGGLEFSELVDGQPQVNTNAYYINKEIKNSGKDLRFRIKFNYSYIRDSNVNFSLIKSGPNFPLKRDWRGLYDNQEVDVLNSQGQLLLLSTQTLIIDEIIPNAQFEIGDSFGIGGFTDNLTNTLIADQSYWVITDASKNVDLWNQPIE